LGAVLGGGHRVKYHLGEKKHRPRKKGAREEVDSDDRVGSFTPGKQPRGRVPKKNGPGGSGQQRKNAVFVGPVFAKKRKLERPRTKVGLRGGPLVGGKNGDGDTVKKRRLGAGSVSYRRKSPSRWCMANSTSGGLGKGKGYFVIKGTAIGHRRPAQFSKRLVRRYNLWVRPLKQE